MALVQDSITSLTQQKVFNYERNLIQSSFESLPQPYNNCHAKYTVFDINTKIRQLIKNQPHNLRWIGNGSNALIESYFYCVLMLSASDSKTFIMLKNVFYQMCRKYLNFQQQKLLVQFLCLLEFSNDKYLFLKKYPIIQYIVFKVFNSILKDKKLEIDTNQIDSFEPCLSFNKISREEVNYEDNFKSENYLQISKITEIYDLLTKKFSFIQFKQSGQGSFQFKNQNNQKMFVILQKEYFFVLQVLDESQVIPKKSKLTKGDLNQVQRLLNQDKNKEQINLQQNKKNINPFELKDQNKNKGANTFKNNFRSFFPSKSSKKKQKTSKKQSLKPQNQNQQEYLDLMESSFQESKNSEEQIDHIKQIQNHQLNSFKFYKPKTFTKKNYTPSFLYSKKKNSDQKKQEIDINKRKRSPSEIDKNYLTTINYEHKQIKICQKDFQLNSPPKFIEDFKFKQKRHSPIKKCVKQEQLFKQKFDFFSKFQCDKQKIKRIQKSHYNLSQSFGKIPSNEQKGGRSLQKKTNFFPTFSPKIFNNRISLQSRQDLLIFSNPKIIRDQLFLNRIPQVERNQELSTRDYIEKKMIRDEPCQSLNNQIYTQMKNKFLEQLEGKSIGSKSIQKRYRSIEQKETQPSEQNIPPPMIRAEDSQCPQKTVQFYDGYEITIIMTEKQDIK